MKRTIVIMLLAIICLSAFSIRSDDPSDDEQSSLNAANADSETIDFNLLTETGSHYVHGKSLRNAPLDLTSGKFILTNSEVIIGGDDRRLLQMCYVQSPSYLKGTTWYRLFDPAKNKIYVGWASNDHSGYMSNITIFGDSITSGHPNGKKDIYHWWAYLKKYFNINNFASSGAGIIFKSNKKSGITFAKKFNDPKCNYLCIFMGTNDYGTNMPLGSPSDPPGQDTVCAGLRYMIETVMSKNPALSIIGILPINRSDKGTFETNWAYGTENKAGYTLSQLCDALKTVYEDYGIPVIDNRTGVFQRANLKSLLGDGLHPNIKGYRKLAQHLGGEILRIICPIN